MLVGTSYRILQETSYVNIYIVDTVNRLVVLSHTDWWQGKWVIPIATIHVHMDV